MRKRKVKIDPGLEAERTGHAHGDARARTGADPEPGFRDDGEHRRVFVDDGVDGAPKQVDTRAEREPPQLQCAVNSR